MKYQEYDSICRQNVISTKQYVLCFSDEALITEEDLEDQAYVDYDTGGYSPKLLRQADLEIDSVVYDPTDDMRKLELARQQVLSTGRVRVRTHLLGFYILRLIINTNKKI